ncbi:uncharacterized protein Z519_06339 [Cladophialophora bantiana CBS 173.52]|uniref:Uncharacterized protein n=1 Tax=Cladophialophora bantiana (strain ATCC 10958 / CBS 173.52 / CDC B-1940 / NIH 8579) TaxID=1442370 RepID=A0A0D2G189_CLAB1|nr:uncharacterized protein Z519_06339 [Cladophialophora bantiana CBS 173.52]KIW92492.1 hypothetical protein Z519_06339 [Cladophialophora bantiana CBS 173.52]
MDPALPRFMTRMILSTTPQQAFQQVDELVLQAAALREQTKELQGQIDFLNDRADCLTTTAEGLQEFAKHDRDAIQTIFERSLSVYKHMYAMYVSAPRKAARFNDIRTRSEDGMVTMEEMEAFLEDVYQYFLVTSERTQRSATPEPESPPCSSDALPSIDPAQSESEAEFPDTRGLKRKLSAVREEDESGPDASSEGSDTVKDCVRSEHHPLSNENDEDESVRNAKTQDENSGGNTRNMDESSDQEPESASNKDFDHHHVDSETTRSSDKGESSAPTSSHGAANAVKPAPKQYLDGKRGKIASPFCGTSKAARQRQNKQLGGAGFVWNASQRQWERPDYAT